MFEITGRRSGNVLLDASASESRHPDGDIVFYDWDISEDEYRVHVVQETPQLDAWWLVGGTYTVTLTVVDDRGGISTTQQTFDVDSSWFDRFVLIVADWLGYKDDGTVSSLWMNPQDLLPQPLKWYFHGDWIQLDEIDKWLRYGEGERLDWTDIDPEDIVYVLNKEVVQGLTYGECMKLVTEEEEIVHDGFEYYGQRSYTRNFPAVSAFLRKLGADAAKTALTSGVAKLIELPWQIGLIIEGIDAVSGIPSWLEIVGDIKEGQLRQAFGLYVGHRTGLDIADQTWKDALKAAMGDAAEDMEEFEATKAYFESLYNTYEPYYTSGSGPRGYRNQIRQEMKDLICGLVESYRNELPSKQKWYKRLIFWNPGELRLYDANGNVTGLVNGGIEEGIENSIFLPEEEAIALYGWVDVAYAELVGTHEGDYGLSGYWRHEGVEVTFTASNIPVTPGEIHRYAVDWDALSQGEEGVTVDVDSDGDGVFERTITSDSELTRDEFMSQPGCFIATAAYGTPMAEEIQVLREFRDEYLLTNPLGEAFVDLYYRTSPPIAEFITEHPGLKPIVSTGLVPAVAMSAIVVNATATEKGVIVGILVLVSVAVALWVTRRQGKGIQHT
ncbi:MAG: CFI-box-CTERM domain-containing protein [Dehalococcoidia bacterium]